MTAHAYALIDSYVYGFALQEAALPFEGSDTAAAIAGVDDRGVLLAGSTRTCWRCSTEHVLKPGYAFGDEFDFGLDLILDGLGASLG